MPVWTAPIERPKGGIRNDGNKGPKQKNKKKQSLMRKSKKKEDGRRLETGHRHRAADIDMAGCGQPCNCLFTSCRAPQRQIGCPSLAKLISALILMEASLPGRTPHRPVTCRRCAFHLDGGAKTPRCQSIP